MLVDPKTMFPIQRRPFIRNLADRMLNPSSTINAGYKGGINLSGSAMSGLGVRFGSQQTELIQAQRSNSRFVATNTTHNTINMWIKKERDAGEYSPFNAGIVRLCNKDHFTWVLQTVVFFCHTLAADGTFETNTPFPYGKDFTQGWSAITRCPLPVIRVHRTEYSGLLMGIR